MTTPLLDTVDSFDEDAAAAATAPRARAVVVAAVRSGERHVPGIIVHGAR